MPRSQVGCPTEGIPDEVTVRRAIYPGEDAVPAVIVDPEATSATAIIDTLCHPAYPAVMAPRTTLNVSLTPELSELVEARVRSGKYQSASEVVREGLRLLDARDRTPVGSVEELKAEIELGLEQLRRGERVDGEEFFARLRAQRAE